MSTRLPWAYRTTSAPSAIAISDLQKQFSREAVRKFPADRVVAVDSPNYDIEGSMAVWCGLARLRWRMCSSWWLRRRGGNGLWLWILRLRPLGRPRSRAPLPWCLPCSSSMFFAPRGLHWPLSGPGAVTKNKSSDREEEFDAQRSGVHYPYFRGDMAVLRRPYSIPDRVT